MVARVLLIEDDTLIRRFVRMALEELPIELVEAATIAQALDRLREAPADVLLTDLMLPDGHGADLLDTLRSDPPRLAHAQCIVFSAGVSAAMRQRLEALGVRRILDKPVTMGALIDAVEQALAGPRTPLPLPVPVPMPVPVNEALDPPAAPPCAAAGPAVAAPEPLERSEAEAEAEAAAIATHFAGQAGLFAAFKASSLAQLAEDAAAGDAAFRDGDLGAVHRLAHSLKSVLQLLGRDAASERARALERAASERAPLAELLPMWRRLRADLVATD